MFYAIAVILILVCVVVIGGVILRKFPQLTLINTEHLPQERDARQKKAMINDRATRMAIRFGRRIAEGANALFQLLRDRFRVTYRRVLAFERRLRKGSEKPLVRPQEQDARIDVLMAEAAALVEKEEYGEAEKRYITVLTIDKRNVDAYHGLGALYFAWKRYDQAKETYGFLGRMLHKRSRCAHTETGELPEGAVCEANAETHADIADCAVEAGLAAQLAGETAEARTAFERAAAFAPANPRHLDLLLEACILEGDKARSLQVFTQLQQANPENQKLGQFAQRIHEMQP